MLELVIEQVVQVAVLAVNYNAAETAADSTLLVEVQVKYVYEEEHDKHVIPIDLTAY